MNDIQGKVGGNWVVVWGAIESAGIRRDKAVTLHLKGVSAKAALDAVFALVGTELDPDYGPLVRVDQGVYWVTTTREARGITAWKDYDVSGILIARQTTLDLLTAKESCFKALKTYARAHGLDETVVLETEMSRLDRLERKMGLVERAVLADINQGKPPEQAVKSIEDVASPAIFELVSSEEEEERMHKESRGYAVESIANMLRDRIGSRVEWDDGMSRIDIQVDTLCIRTTRHNHEAIHRFLADELVREQKRQEAMLEHVYVMNFVARSWQTLQKTHDPAMALKEARQALALAPDHPTAKAFVALLEKMEKRK